MTQKYKRLISQVLFAGLLAAMAFPVGVSADKFDLPNFPKFPASPSFPDFFRPSQQEHHARVCNRDDVNPLTAACDARVVTDAAGNAKNFIAPSGYGPTAIEAAYGVTGLSGKGKVIGIVDAYDDPRIQSDLQIYSSPTVLPACLTAPEH